MSSSKPEKINDPQSLLQDIRIKIANRLVVAPLSINSLRNKLQQLSAMVSENIDIYISETKLDETLPTTQFSLQGFCNPYRFDGNRNGGGIILFVREDNPHDL